MSLICASCRRELLEEEMPDDPHTQLECPLCKSGEFVSVKDPPRDPDVPWKLEPDDKRLLRRLRITQE